ILSTKDAKESLANNKIVPKEDSPRATATGMPINMNTNKNTKSITVVMAYPVLLHQFHRYEVAMHLRPRHRPGRRLCLGVNQSVPAKNARTTIRSLTAIPRAGSTF